MQLYAGWLEGELTDRQAVKDWLAGNLCRCTGYGPIVDAGLEAGTAPPARTALRSRRRRSGSRARRRRDAASRRMASSRSSRRARPTSWRRSISQHPDAVLVAGATDVGLWVTKQHRHLKTLIDVTRVKDLAVVDEDEDGLTIGATGQPSRRDGGARAPASRPRRADAPLRLDPDPQRRHGRRQHRQRLADRRPAAGADRARARLTLRRGVGAARNSAGGLLHRLRQAGPRAGRVRRVGVRAGALAPEHALRLLQDLQALRPGYFRRHGRVPAEARARQGRRRRGSPSAAWRRRRSARRRPRRRWSGSAFDAAAVERAAAALAEDFAPITDMRASAGYRLKAAQNLLRRFHLENAAATKPATRVLELA